MKKVLSLFMVLLFAISLFACGNKESKEPTVPIPATPEQVTPITPPETSVLPPETPVTPSNPEIEIKEDPKTGIQTQMVFYKEVYDILGAPDVCTTSPWSSYIEPRFAYYMLDDGSVLKLMLDYGKTCSLYTTYQNGIASGDIAHMNLEVVTDFEYVTNAEFEEMKQIEDYAVDSEKFERSMEMFKALFIEYI